jgi:tetratricopeptide (TPR) repeat protein
MKIFLFLLLAGFPFFAKAQDYDSVKLYIENFEFRKAIDHVDRIRGDVDVETLNLKAIALKQLNQHRKAIQVYKEMMDYDTNNPRYTIEMANCYQKIDDHENAILLYKKVLPTRSKNLYLFLRIAESYYKDENFQQAIENFLIAYKMDSSHYASKQLARSYEKMGKRDSAIYYYKKTLEINPRDFFTSYTLASLLRKQKEYNEAISITESYLAGDSLKRKMWQLNGYINFLHKKYDASIQAFEKCTQLGDTSNMTCKHLGFSYFKNGEYELAKTYLEEAYKEDTTNIDLCYVLGLSCSRSLYKKLGIRYLKQALKFAIPKPTFLSQLYQDLASAQTAHYKYDSAMVSYHNALKLTPHDTLLIFKIGSHYDNWLDDKKKALEYYQDFMQTKPKNYNSPGSTTENLANNLSYYDYVEKRIEELKEDIFWERGNDGKKDELKYIDRQ